MKNWSMYNKKQNANLGFEPKTLLRQTVLLTNGLATNSTSWPISLLPSKVDKTRWTRKWENINGSMGNITGSWQPFLKWATLLSLCSLYHSYTKQRKTWKISFRQQASTATASMRGTFTQQKNADNIWNHITANITAISLSTRNKTGLVEDKNKSIQYYL